MRFGTDPDQVADVYWYFCEPDAPDLGISTCFASRNWNRGEVWPDKGEVQFAKRAHRNDALDKPPTGFGDPAGDPEVWRRGFQGTVPPVFPRNGFGTLMACGGLLDEPGKPTIGFVGQSG